MRRMELFCGMLILFGLAACGGDSLQSIDRSKAMSEITLEESRTICENMAASVNIEAMQEGTCYFLGLLASSFDSSVDCESAAQECIADFNEQEVQLNCELSSQAELDAMPACAAMVTLGEFQDCQIASIEAAAKLLAPITCESEELPTSGPMPAACDPVVTKCAALLEDDGAAN